MIVISKAQDRVVRAVCALHQRCQDIDEKERGDVPGWVLITIMTAGLVTVLWGVAQGTLSDLFEHAVRGVTGGK